ncbi:methyl-accepting chemotaxis protein [bacterium]|nr:methyl-accepting chemotaxis protein [bacterium]
MQNLLHSIAFKTIAILVVSCGLIAFAVSYLGDKAGREIAVRGVEAVAETQTASMAERLVGPLRFKRYEDVTVVLEDALIRSDLAVDAIVLVQDASILTRPDNNLSEANMILLTGLAEQAVASGEIARSADGLKVAIPIRKSEGDPVVGAVATFWTSEPFLKTIAEYRQLQIGGAVVALSILALAAACAVRFMVSAPLARVEGRASDMADGDLDASIPGLGRKGEIGRLASSMESLRSNLHDAKTAAEAAFYESAGFQASSAAQILCDEEFVVVSGNAEFERLLTDVGLGGLDPYKKTIDVFEISVLKKKHLEQTDMPLRQEFSLHEKTLAVVVKPVTRDGVSKGYVIEWQDITEQKVSEGTLRALEQGQLRIDFDRDGQFVSASDRARDLLGAGPVPNMDSMLSCEQGNLASVKDGTSYFGRITLEAVVSNRLLDGSISPIKDAEENVLRFVMLGSDVTDAEMALSAARKEAERMTASQTEVVTHLQDAMRSLSEGVLSARLKTAFAGEYEALRADFNKAIACLDVAIGEVINSSAQIGLDVDSVAHSIEEFARRTEKKAASLEETSSAVSQLSTSVANATRGAREARDTVLSARDRASSSSQIVSESVGAMTAIEASSHKISSIISVMDEIAFQTNLLALNAGVEAARAGEAGRGFAVVASEVRELAQRSAGAASEISDLITASDEQVKIGVDLVGKAGTALTEIAELIGLAAGKVENITNSTEEQASGIEEINQAMQSLDQATQQDAAMIEETTASARALQVQSKVLESATSGFDLTGADTTENDAAYRAA